MIGRSLGHSASADYFAAKFAREELADCVYTLQELADIAELPQWLAANPDLRGFNVTIPYKRDIIPFLDRLSPEARAVGAVNCVRCEADGTLTGYNTDIVGLRASLDALVGDMPIERALILGTGGASQAVQYILKEREIFFSTVSRKKSRQTSDVRRPEIAGQARNDIPKTHKDNSPIFNFQLSTFNYDNLSSEVIAQSRLIINATPVGMYPAVADAPPIDYKAISSEHFLLDLVYNPPLTRFLELGRRHGAHTLSGQMMFEAQAEASWKIWNINSK